MFDGFVFVVCVVVLLHAPKHGMLEFVVGGLFGGLLKFAGGTHGVFGSEELHVGVVLMFVVVWVQDESNGFKIQTSGCGAGWPLAGGMVQDITLPYWSWHTFLLLGSFVKVPLPPGAFDKYIDFNWNDAEFTAPWKFPCDPCPLKLPLANIVKVTGTGVAPVINPFDFIKESSAAGSILAVPKAKLPSDNRTDCWLTGISDAGMFMVFVFKASWYNIDPVYPILDESRFRDVSFGYKINCTESELSGFGEPVTVLTRSNEVRGMFGVDAETRQLPFEDVPTPQVIAGSPT